MMDIKDVRIGMQVKINATFPLTSKTGIVMKIEPGCRYPVEILPEFSSVQIPMGLDEIEPVETPKGDAT